MNESEMHDLMLKSMAGDGAAHRRLLVALAVRLRSYVSRRMFADLEAVDDIVQEILLVFPVTAFETDSGVLLKECFGSS
jgi:hypothetical protein